MLTIKTCLLLTLAVYATCTRDNDKKKEKQGSLRNLGKLMKCCEINEEDVSLCSRIAIGSKLDNPRRSQKYSKTERKKINSSSSSSQKNESSQEIEELGKYLTATSSGRGFGSSSRISVEYALHNITEESEGSSEDECYTIIPNKKKGKDQIKQTESSDEYYTIIPHHFDESTDRGNLDAKRSDIGKVKSDKTNEAGFSKSFDNDKTNVNSNNRSSSNESTMRDKH
ncbi:uncharacterized protein LOC126833006 [Adelges cooleyi]|uniref:uncharacterized protein LOC126833006 n=1 Tax=Adelges cooleyi TaxID=133065 RepID=UPI00217FA009|nr:uncharacterized protein LOC126833006 [Adelges cooleyi]